MFYQNKYSKLKKMKRIMKKKNNVLSTLMMFMGIMSMVMLTSCGGADMDDNSYADPANGHEYVDLGLSVKWATCNIGANNPWEYGDYFAWGETNKKNYYDWTTYKWCNGTDNSLTKYNDTSEYGVVDNKKQLELNDDAAHVNWGGAWRMPTDENRQELYANCYCEWTNNYKNTNVKGFIFYKVKNNNDKGKMKFPNGGDNPSEYYTTTSDTHIFLPAAGAMVASDGLWEVGIQGNYYTSKGYGQDANGIWFRNEPQYATMMTLGGISPRCYGCSVRPVIP